jgi:hypothetical protein
MNLSEQQIAEVRQFLQSSGLTFKPLLEEMMDHITSDLEERINAGSTYEAAWSQAISELPEDHFKHIQQETMETINKQFNLSRMLSIATLGLLLTAALFKMMHLAGAGWVLLSALTTLAALLTVSSLSGVFMNKGKEGAFRVMAIVAGTVLMLLGVAFKLLHLPGADQLIAVGVLTLVTALLMNTFYVYNNASGQGNLLTFLHEKYSPGIERFLLILLAPLVIYRFVTLVTAPQEYFANFVLVVVIYGAGLQLLTLAWRNIENDLSHRTPFTLALLIVTAVTLTLPMLGEMMPYSIRLLSITIFTFCAATLAYRIEQPKGTSVIFAIGTPLLFVAIAAIKIGWMPSFTGDLWVNIIIVAAMIGGIFISRASGVMRTYMILSLASYLLES